MTWDFEGRPERYQVELGELMGWVALSGVCLTVARAAPALGVASACVLVPAQARTLHRARLRKSGGERPGLRVTLVEMARSTGLFLRAYAWALGAFVKGTIVFGFLLFALAVFFEMGLSTVVHKPVRFDKPDLALMAGALLSLPEVPIAFLRALRRGRTSRDRREAGPLRVGA